MRTPRLSSRTITSESHVEMTETLKDADHEPSQAAETFENAGVIRQSTTTLDTDETETPTYRRDLKISIRTAHMLWFSGLRGAVA